MSLSKYIGFSALSLSLLLGIMYPISGFQDLPQVLVAWGTLMLATATFLLIRNTKEQEKRNRQEQSLNEIAAWLKDFEYHIFTSYKIEYKNEILEDKTIETKSGIPLETWDRIRNLDNALIEQNSLDKGIKEAEYYKKLTQRINEELGELLGNISIFLKQRKQLLLDSYKRNNLSRREIHEQVQKEADIIDELLKDDSKSLDGCGLSEEGLTMVRLGRNAGDVRKAIYNAIDKAIELKMNLLI